MKTEPLPAGTVIHALAAGGGLVRGVLLLDDGRIALAETRGRTAEDVAAGARALFQPASLERVARFAECVVAGDARAISDPKGMLVLATAVLALVVGAEAGALPAQAGGDHGE